MLVSKVRKDGVFDGFEEFPDGTTIIPSGYSFSLPPDIPEGYHAVMRAGWRLILGDKPEFPSREEKDRQLYQEIVDATQNRLDEFAKTRDYANILSACTYVNSTVAKFKSEAEYCIAARDSTWNQLYKIFEEVQSGTREKPSSFSDIEQELPLLEWPEELPVL